MYVSNFVFLTVVNIEVLLDEGGAGAETKGCPCCWWVWDEGGCRGAAESKGFFGWEKGIFGLDGLWFDMGLDWTTGGGGLYGFETVIGIRILNTHLISSSVTKIKLMNNISIW